MSAQFVSPVKTHRVCAQKPFHPLNQIRPRRLHHQMKMIAHQTISVQLPSGLCANSPETFKEASPVRIVPEDFLAPIPPAHEVINSSLVLNPKLPRHDWHLCRM